MKNVGRRGFTLMELSVVAACGLLVAAGATAGFGHLFRRYRAIITAGVQTEASLMVRNDFYFSTRDQNGYAKRFGVLDSDLSDWKNNNPEGWLSNRGTMGNFWRIARDGSTSITNVAADFGGYIKRATVSSPALPERTVLALVSKREEKWRTSTGFALMRGFSLPVSFTTWFVRQPVPRPNLDDRPQGGYLP